MAQTWQLNSCVILAVDCAERSGWALYVRGQLSDSGEVSALSEGSRVREICARATKVAQVVMGVPAVLVLEAPFRGLAQGQYRGTWRTAFAEAGGKIMAQIHPSTWRARMLGRVNMPREQGRRAEQMRAFQDCMRVHGRAPGEDEAPAVCLGAFATYAPQVAKKLPKRKART